MTYDECTVRHMCFRANRLEETEAAAKLRLWSRIIIFIENQAMQTMGLSFDP
jgi:hypothetical protein